MPFPFKKHSNQILNAKFNLVMSVVYFIRNVLEGITAKPFITVVSVVTALFDLLLGLLLRFRPYGCVYRMVEISIQELSLNWNLNWKEKTIFCDKAVVVLAIISRKLRNSNYFFANYFVKKNIVWRMIHCFSNKEKKCCHGPSVSDRDKLHATCAA